MLRSLEPRAPALVPQPLLAHRDRLRPALAAMLVVQAMLFVWVRVALGSDAARPAPNASRRPSPLDIARGAPRRSGARPRRVHRRPVRARRPPFFVLLADGRVFGNFPPPYPEPLLRAARATGCSAAWGRRPIATASGAAQAAAAGGFGPGPGPMDGPPPPPPPGADRRRRRARRRRRRPAARALLVPAARATRRRSASSRRRALASGALVGRACSIFGPARRRLRAVEDAARRLGAGDLSARAPGPRRRRSGGGGAGVQRHGRRSGGPRRRARRFRPRAPAAAGRRLARADDAGHGDARLPRNARRCPSSRSTTPTRARYLGDRRRRNRAPRAHHRRSARSGAARRRRRRVRRRRRAGRASCSRASPRGTSARPRDAGVTIAARIEPGAETRPRRSRSAGAGAAEPRRQRASLRAARLVDRAARAGRRPARHRDHRDRPRARHPARTPAARLRSLLQGRRGRGRRPAAAALGCRSSRRSSSGTAGRLPSRASRDGRSLK